MAHEGFWESIFKHGFRSKYLQQFFGQSGLNNWWKGITGSGLTQSEIEQNQWTEQMDNTKYQRQTADMQAAGLNPAMMYGQGMSASTPSASQVGSPSAGLADSVLNMIFARQRMRNLKAEEENINADTRLKGSQVDLNTSQLDEISAKITNLASQSALNDAQREQVSKLTSWIDREKSSLIDLQGANKFYFNAEVRKVDHVIKNLDADTSKKWQEIVNLRQEITKMLHEINLIDQQAIESSTRASLNMDYSAQVIKSIEEIDSKIQYYDTLSEQFRASTGLTHKQTDWYWVDHGLMPGIKIAAGVAAGAIGMGMFAPTPNRIGF